MEKKNILFGLRPIIEAIEAGHEFEKIYLKKGADGVLLNELAALCKARHIRVQWVPVEKLNRLVRGNHQGAVAQISQDLLEKFSYALVWGTSTKYSPQHCGLAHVLEDEDVIQIVKKTVNQEKHDKNYSQQCQAVYDKYKKKKKSGKSS